MKEYQLLCYVGGILMQGYKCELPSLAAALMVAESLVNIESETFFEKVRFYEIKEGKNHQLVYVIERSYEPTDTLAL